MAKKSITPKEEQLLHENEVLRSRLNETMETLNAIRNGDVDVIVVTGSDGEKVFSLASAETPYRIIVEEMNEGAASLSADGTILYCNRRFAELVSVPVEQIVGSNFARFIAENEKLNFGLLMQTGLKGRSSGEIMYFLDKGNLKHFYLSFNALPVNMVGDICIIVTDITKLKQTEKELRLSHDTLEQQIVERTVELTKSIEQLVDSRLTAMNMMKDAVEGKNALEILNKKLFNEIAERKLAEEKLHETNEYLTNLFDHANAPIVVWDISLCIIRFNQAFELLSGYFTEEVIGKKIDLLFPVEKNKSSLDLIKRTITGERWETVEIEILRKDGDSRIVLWNSANIHGKDGITVIATIAQGNDITERKKAEAKLQKSEMQYRSLNENSPDLIARFDQQYRHLYVNQKLAKAGQLSPEEYIDKTIAETGVNESEASRWEARIRTVFETGHVVDVEDAFETPHGKEYFFTKFVPEFAPDGSILSVQTIARDITVRKHSEEKMFAIASRQEAILSAVPDIIMEVNTDKVYTWANKSGTEFLVMM
jgi:PAS domain S-box-containing protein